MAVKFKTKEERDEYLRSREEQPTKLTPPVPSAERTERLRQLPTVRFDSTGRLNDNG